MTDMNHRATAEQWQTIENCNKPAKPDSLLVKRVAKAIPGDGDEPINWMPEARAAIREVAKWLQEHYGGPTATSDLLEREAER